MENDDPNIYAYSRRLVQEEYAPYLSGDPSGLFVAVCTRALSDAARNALVKSAEALGYGPCGVSFIEIDAQDPPLEPAQALRAIEGLDPLCLVCADAPSTGIVRQAYRCDLPATGAARIAGREVRAFDNLGALMDTPAHKQQAWALLKTLPKR